VAGRVGATGPTAVAVTPVPVDPVIVERPVSDTFSFSMGPTNDAPTQTVSASFEHNHMRLACGGGTCSAQVAMGDSGEIFGTDARGTINGAVTSTRTTEAHTPAIATLTAVSGPELESVGAATVALEDGTGWDIHVALVSDSSGNVRLAGTAAPATLSTFPKACAGLACN
jgi:hypothetical protein